jgi:hypothetical protein
MIMYVVDSARAPVNGGLRALISRVGWINDIAGNLRRALEHPRCRPDVRRQIVARRRASDDRPVGGLAATWLRSEAPRAREGPDSHWG